MSYATGLIHRHYENFTLLNTTSAVKISISLNFKTKSGLLCFDTFQNNKLFLLNIKLRKNNVIFGYDT